jgi:hypothetical protein
MNGNLPPAPLWGWHDQVVCCLCAPHRAILAHDDRRFLAKIDRRRGLDQHQAERLARIVAELDRAAQDRGIVWP